MLAKEFGAICLPVAVAAFVSRMNMCVKAVLLAHLNGFTAQAAVEFGRKILYADLRPTFKELDEETKAVKGK